MKKVDALRKVGKVFNYLRLNLLLVKAMAEREGSLCVSLGGGGWWQPQRIAKNAQLTRGISKARP